VFVGAELLLKITGRYVAVYHSKRIYLMTSSVIDCAPLCDPQNFSVENFIQQGGSGRVYSGFWNNGNTQQRVALKFFGYTDREPNERQIYEEIDLLQTLRGIDGIVQLLATFMDHPWGMASGKYFRKSYPCIVMEMLEGGEVFEKIEATGAISESDLALMFRGIVLALDSIHKRRYIHRDVKLENLMFVNNLPNSPVKIIDFGMMVRLKKGKTIYRSPTIQGTAGYVAPESLTYAVYSAASDIWQAGVCLYSMLSGFAPFHPKHPEQITEHTYFPMVGLGWDGISDAAKDLISKILVKYPDERITAAEILRHPWVTTEKAPKHQLGSDYSLRIKHLGIRQKMKTFFVENNIQEHRLRRDNLKLLLPALQDQQMNDIVISQSDEDSFLDDSLNEPRLNRSNSLDSSKDSQEEFSGKVKTLKCVVMNKIVDRSDSRDYYSDSPFGSPPSHSVVPQLLELSFDPNDNSNAIRAMGPDFSPGATTSWDIDYLTFVNVMCESGLEDLANQQVYGIFDPKGNGTINCKDFLLTMLAFIPEEDSPSEAVDENTNPARLFFSLFDINDYGYIGMEELKLVVGCLMQDDSLPMSCISSEWSLGSPEEVAKNGISNQNIEDLFHSIDVNQDGKIDFEEFQSFYDAVLSHSLTRRSYTGILRSKESPRPGSPTVGGAPFSPRCEREI
jgi:serine/threonine protein kinase/Ca2+-binding EF-hand superfamily protein